MIEINLLPPEFRKKDRREIRLPQLPYARLLFGALAFLVFCEAVLLAFTVVERSRAGKLGGEYQRLEPEIKRMRALKEDTARAQARLKALGKLSARPFHWTHVLGALSSAMTGEVWLTEISLDAGGDAAGTQALRPAKARSAGAKDAGKGPAPESWKCALVIRGASAVAGQETGAIGRFIRSLKANEFLKKRVEDFELEKIDRRTVDKVTHFDFTVTGPLKTAWSGDPGDFPAAKEGGR